MMARMSRRPFLHAGAASLYIVLVVLCMSAVSSVAGPEDTIASPMMALSLLVLSVAVMAYLFFYHPVVMLLDGKQEEAAAFFLKTVGAFAVLTAVVAAASALLAG